jgi:hypothetical protein
MSARRGIGMGRLAAWEMTEREQTSLLASSAVYLIARAGPENRGDLTHRKNSFPTSIAALDRLEPPPIV